jgi:poly-gamma-glutamate synthesis protein (capsule biosynthesis protein)
MFGRARFAAIAVLVVLGAGLGLALAGPSGSDDEGATDAGRAREAPTSQEPASSTGSSTTTTIGRRGSGEPVTLAFAGDVHFEGGIRSKVLADPDGLLAPVAPLLRSVDLAVVNLETAITERGTPAAKEYTFRAPAVALRALSAAGVDVASMANNHGLDFGLEGLEDTLTAARDTGFPLIGVGRDARAAYEPFRATVRGQRIAVIGATQVLDGALVASWTAGDDQPGLASAKEVDRLVTAVAAARATSDTVVVFLHWGVERATCPSVAQRDLARALVDAGADVIVGGHAHRLQGAGRLGDALVAYGLGNFLFSTRPGPGAESGVLTVTVTGRDVDAYAWHPARLADGVPRPLEGRDADAARAAWAELRGCTGLAP